jgi:uncharacterized membrane protein
MWTCKHCGEQVRGHFVECSSCGYVKNWSPPTETESLSPDAIVPEISSPAKTPPFSDAATGFLRILAFGIAIVGVIAGIVVLANSPTAPSDIAVRFGSNDLPTQIQSANRMLYLAVGWGQIIAGITTGVFLYVVAGIGDAVLDLWTAQQSEKQRVSSKAAI